ncbi:MAG: 3-methyl-2-oxobutanoate hydroxymethyltransferase [Candidatus Saganbacteria bacterium]|nr:3-methyl-2-oxobutanoate hydroxymethyltransferase [Candidatus Saganbacteria bacterium]
MEEKSRKIKKQEKICMLTAYDFPTALFLEEAGVDIVLVGDSLGNVILGYANTLPVTLEDMLHHTKAVRRGIKKTLLVVDFPAAGFKGNAFKNAQKLVKESGADAIKIEGIENLGLIKKLIKAKIAVMGHIGYTPQLSEKPGIQGKTEKLAKQLLSDALKLEKAGVFALVLELVEAKVAGHITKALKIPTISCGSGSSCRGQVVVTHDLVGLYPGKVPSFVKPYANLGLLFKEAIKQFISDIKH